MADLEKPPAPRPDVGQPPSAVQEPLDATEQKFLNDVRRAFGG